MVTLFCNLIDKVDQCEGMKSCFALKIHKKEKDLHVFSYINKKS